MAESPSPIVNAAPATEAAPLIAYRGLWDRFAAPGTLDAIRRGYLRGVPSRVRLGDPRTPLADVMALVADPAVNRRRQAVYLETPRATGRAGLRRVAKTSYADAPGLPDVQAAPSWLRIFAIAADGRAQTWPIFRWNRHAWIRVGLYVPVSALKKGVDQAAMDISASSLVLFESLNVIDVIAERRKFPAIDDHDVSVAIRQAAGPHAGVARVSDLVELDQLDASLREAC